MCSLAFRKVSWRHAAMALLSATSFLKFFQVISKSSAIPLDDACNLFWRFKSYLSTTGNLLGLHGRQRAIFVALMGNIIRIHESKRYCCGEGNYVWFRLFFFSCLCCLGVGFLGDFGLAAEGIAGFYGIAVFVGVLSGVLVGVRTKMLWTGESKSVWVLIKAVFFADGVCMMTLAYEGCWKGFSWA